jgi:uncharacterized protein YecE (DUF72 family)
MIHVGTCGFSYREWAGPFYPPAIKPQAMLAYYAARFTAVEIDSTYYAIPKASMFESMAQRTRQEFRFCVKAPGSITHVPADAAPERSDFDAFAECLDPLQRRGRLAVVLAQFPGAFRPGREAFGRLESLRREWPDMQLVAEFRHRDWQRDSVLRILQGLDIGWCNVDEPALQSLMHPDAQVTSAVGYIRFHGRNAAKWWKQERASAERYDYLYTVEELTDWLPRIADVAERAKETFVFFNNHRNGQAATNARQMAELLDLEPPLPAADEHDPQLSLLE